MSVILDTLPERPSYVRDAEYWEACCERHGTIMLPCGLCDYEGEVPWDPVMSESGQWHCPQCDRLRPFLDFERLWLAPGRKIAYHGSVDLLARGWHKLRDVVPVARVWRQCDDDPIPYFLHTDPETGERRDFDWGLRRYEADRLPALTLACTILHDFYGWLSWADFEITEEPYSQERWAQEHAAAFLNEAITRLPNQKPWTLTDADLNAALRQIVPTSFSLEAPDVRD
jgi:hypothetical protein